MEFEVKLNLQKKSCFIHQAYFIFEKINGADVVKQFKDDNNIRIQTDLPPFVNLPDS